MRLRIETAGAGALAHALERAAGRAEDRIETFGPDDRRPEPLRPPERADMRPWPAPRSRRRRRP